jgi:hypothetical protein
LRSGRFSAITFFAKARAAGAQLAFRHDLIEQACGEAGLRIDVRARCDHLQRLFRADDAWQALRSARTGQQTEMHFGQAALRRRHSDAIVATQRSFQAAAERGAVDRGDDGLGRILDRVADIVQARRLRRFAELGDVGAGDECPAVADQHYRLDGGVGDRLLHAFDDAVAHLLRQRVHGRRIDGQHGDVALRSQIRNGIDGPHRESLLEKIFENAVWCGTGIIGR